MRDPVSFNTDKTGRLDTISPVKVAALALPVTGLLISEALRTVGFISGALWGYTLTLFICSLAPLVVREAMPIMLAFVLLPTFRLVNLAMPTFVELTLYWLVLIYFPFLIAGAYLRWRGGFNEFITSIPRLAIWSSLAVVGGVVLGEVEYYLTAINFLLERANLQGIALLLAVLVLISVTEELLFRGVLQVQLDQEFGTGVALLITSIVFAAMQGPTTWMAGLVALVSGFGYGIFYVGSGSLVVPILFHIVSDGVLFLLAPIYGTPTQLIGQML